MITIALYRMLMDGRDSIEALPNTFQTPMFWTDEQIQELKGTDIVDKIGRQSAEDTYNQKIKPILQVREIKTHPAR